MVLGTFLNSRLLEALGIGVMVSSSGKPKLYQEFNMGHSRLLRGEILCPF